MTDDVIYELSKIYLKEIDKKEEKIIITKKELINFCIKLMKVIKRIDETRE